MACHAGKGKSDCYAVLRLTIVKRHMLQTRVHVLPNTHYAAMRANHVLQESAETVQGKKRGAQSGPNAQGAEDVLRGHAHACVRAAHPGRVGGGARTYGRELGADRIGEGVHVVGQIGPASAD